jgi:3-deoxy-D-manno-octulosonic-acid transferase
MCPGSPTPFRLRRLVFAGFQALASVLMLMRDRQPLASWWGHLGACLGCVDAGAERSIWIHGEGMGEFNAARELIVALRERAPGIRLVFTTSRSAICDWLRAKYPDDIALPHPWDLPFAVRRFTQQLRPSLIVLLEFHDGFCPGALRWAKAAGVPVVVVNGRTLPAGRPWRFRLAAWFGLVGDAARQIDGFIVQDDDAAADVAALGVAPERIRVAGNLKYDVTPTAADGLRTQWRLPAYAPLVIAGCIHADEEGLIVAAFARLRQSFAKLRFLIAPYSLTQLDSIEARLRDVGLTSRRVSGQRDDDASVLILDTLGTLAAAYGLGQLVVLGGSFTPSGLGHSLVEPAAHGKPIVLGPHTSSQTSMMRTFLAASAVLQVEASRLSAALEQLLREPDVGIDMGERARAVVEQNAGATDRTLAALAPFLSRTAATRLQASRERERPEETRTDIAPSAKRAVRSLVHTLASTSAAQLLLRTRSRRIETLAALREHLGQPDTILCLGNGPSSEAPCLAHLPHDCLFRVNWRWVERDRFRQPDVIFTGDRESLRHCPACLFGFRTIAEETSVLWHTFADRRGRANYFTVERLPLWVNRDWPARPTNGAAMIAVAAALAPRRLVIAGIDLFEHPAGRYPGQPADNRYAPMHDRDVELAILREALARFAGEVRIISPTLAEALAPRRGMRPAA